MDDPAQHVSVEKFFATYQGAMTNAKAILPELLRVPFTHTPGDIREALAGAVLTADEVLTDSQKQWLAVLRA